MHSLQTDAGCQLCKLYQNKPHSQTSRDSTGSIYLHGDSPSMYGSQHKPLTNVCKLFANILNMFATLVACSRNFVAKYCNSTQQISV